MGTIEETVTEHFATSLDHILAELEWVDLLVRAQVWRARQIQTTDEGFQGLFLSDAEIDALLDQPAGLPRWATVPGSLPPAEIQTAVEHIRAVIAQRKTTSAQQDVILRLDELARLFDLSLFERDVLLICLGPEIDPRYERLYAYLQDDVTKKHPSVDLVLNLLCASLDEKLVHRQHFTPDAPLLKHHLLSVFTDLSQHEVPLLGRHLKLDDRVVNYLFDSDDLDPQLVPYVRHISPQVRIEDLLLPDDIKHRLVKLVQQIGATQARPLFYFQGPYGVGKQTTAEALCGELGLGLLAVDGASLLNTQGADFKTLAHLAGREAWLQRAALYWTGFDALLADDKRVWLDILWRALEDWPEPIFLAGETAWEPADTVHTQTFVRVEFPHPNYTERIALWTRALNGHIPDKSDVLSALATRFRFSGGQIVDAAATARNLARWRDPERGQISTDDLYTACRLQSNRKLAAVAQKITPHDTWSDIVLPPDRMEQLREICNHVRFRARVYGEWGFDRKLSLGKGLNALFAGPSGTGKTMAAEIMAGELGLDLYKIDLSTVVSKYVGETEKNLARIFAEAETSNAILFFDEADALFGKRSEVKDAHDRYANIEISYLLQRMEAYEGVTILATNLRKNMDDAFVRRMHFIVEFPLPNEQDRRRIWNQIWPDDTPLAPALDLDLMARRFELAGGNIRNIVLAAAFLAADDGQKVDMPHLIHATRREYQKMGKVVTEGEFGKYAGHVRGGT
jgi:AAA+ superfamily predicted ATPase